MNNTAIEQITLGNCHVKRIVIYRDDAPDPKKVICRVGDRVFDRYFYVTKGTIYIQNKYGEEVVADAGSIVYLPADVEYVSHWDATVKGGYISFNFELEDLNGKHMELDDVSVVVAKDKNANIRNLFERAHEYYMQHEKFANLKLISLFYRITYAIFKQIDKQSYKAEQTAQEIYKAMVYLNDNYMSKVTTEELAIMCNVSEATFRRLFKEHNGVSPVKYKNHLRMLHAQDMLRSGYYTASEVSDIVGCSDLSHFNKLYRSEFGVNPSEEIPNFD